MDNNFTMVNFFDWLDEELDQRNWVRADLARRAKISESGLSMAYSGKRGIGPGMLKAIAIALNLPEETVFRAAGLLSQVSEIDELKSEILALTANMSREEQREVLNYIRFRNDLAEGKQGASAPAAGKLAKNTAK
jgi:transcriptional regulator with XRE-family HTH domain